MPRKDNSAVMKNLMSGKIEDLFSTQEERTEEALAEKKQPASAVKPKRGSADAPSVRAMPQSELDNRLCDKKAGIRYTQINSEAIELYKLVHCLTGRVDSRIVNLALTEFLAKELEALRKVDPACPPEDRLREAMKLL